MTKTLTIDDLRNNNLIIAEFVSGSNAYGTNTPESDRDIRGVFVQPLEHVLKYGFIEQVSDKTNDIVFYELGRFIDLLSKNNPNIVELLGMPEDCVIYKHDLFKEIEKFTPKFLTKKVRWTFAGYAIAQIQKARGYNKKMNWEETEMKRKTVLDFCYILQNNDAILFEEWADDFSELSFYRDDIPTKTYTQEDFGLAKIDHAHDLYAIYLSTGERWGIVSDNEKANDVQLISIPKQSMQVAYLSFNKDAYSGHCARYKEYETWLKERNPNRVKMNKDHGKNYDSKNLMHCVRLLSMAHELAKGELRVRRTPEEIEHLMKIRKGEYEYEDLLYEAEQLISTLDEVFEKSTLRTETDSEFALDLLLNLRKTYYDA